MNKTARNLLVDILRHPFAWPGGYERALVTADGALLCKECCRKNASRIMGDIRDGYDTGWLPSGMAIEAVSPDCTSDEYKSNCDHCGKEFGELS